MLQLEEAVSKMLALLPAAQPEFVPLERSLGRILLQPPVGTVDLPPFNNSAMDGYAVRAEDTIAATAESPVPLRLARRVVTGSGDAGEIAPGTCARVFTGSLLPAGADAVVMQEDASMSDEFAERVMIQARVVPGEAVRLRGEDVKAGNPLGEPGTVVAPGLIALMAASGIDRVQVGRQPRVGIVSTGSELRAPPGPLLPGQIFDSNRPTLAVLLRALRLEPSLSLLVRDTREETAAALARAFEECEVIISSGGVSVGETDHVKQAFEEMGGRIDFWRIAIKPGKPFVCGRLRDRFLLGLPGNPVSAFVTFLLLVRPFLLRWQGAADVAMRRATARLREAVRNSGPRRHFMSAILDSAGEVRLTGAQGSHRLASLARANALLDVAAESALSAGEEVRVLVLDQ